MKTGSMRVAHRGAALGVLILAWALASYVGRTNGAPAPDAAPAPPDLGVETALAAEPADGAATAQEATSAPSGSAEDAAARLVLLISSQQAGELEPCGCAEGQYGGLPRRASLVHAWRSAGRRVLVADNGDLVLDSGLQSQQKFQTTLEVHQAMRTAALNPGEQDLLLDPSTVEFGAMNLGLVYVSANVKPVTATHVVETVEVGDAVIRVGITGFLDPDLVEEAAPGWQVQAPAPALKNVLPELSRSADVIVLLAHATAEATERALRGQEVQPDVIVVAHEAEDPLLPIPTVGRGIPALAPGTQAKYLARADVQLGPDGPELQASYEGLTEKIPDLPLARALLDNYQLILKQLNIADRTPRRPYATGGTYVGPHVCAECHASASQVWKDSKHAHALETLVTRNHEFDPDCLGCHTTGFGYVGGYTSREKTAQLAFVSCESCHGPGSNHAQDPGPGYGEVETPAFCLTCHDEPNSPHFDFETYWPKIAHGHD